jgi:hypothetical protein
LDTPALSAAIQNINPHEQMVSAGLAHIVGNRSIKILLQAASVNRVLRNDSQKCRATRLKQNGDQEWLPKRYGGDRDIAYTAVAESKARAKKSCTRTETRRLARPPQINIPAAVLTRKAGQRGGD